MKTVSKYLLFLFPSLILGMLAWSVLVAGKLYYCTDPIPIFDFFPPFMHGSQNGDYWIASPLVVWGVWLLFLIVMFTAPYVFAKKMRPPHHA